MTLQDEDHSRMPCLLPGSFLLKLLLGVDSLIFPFDVPPSSSLLRNSILELEEVLCSVFLLVLRTTYNMAP